MGCEHYREVLSAGLDGETGPAEQAGADAHLADCDECRRWLDAAAAVTRLLRTSAAPGTIDVTDSVLPAAPGRWRGRVAVALRVALGALGTAQLVLGLLQVATPPAAGGHELHGTTIDGASPAHLWHESAAWNLAVGVAFLWVAARRGRPGSIVPILTAFVGLLALLSAVDVVVGDVEVTRLASHGILLVGYLVVLTLSRAMFDTTPPEAPARRPTSRVAAGPAGRVVPFPTGRSVRGEPRPGRGAEARAGRGAEAEVGEGGRHCGQPAAHQYREAA